MRSPWRWGKEEHEYWSDLRITFHPFPWTWWKLRCYAVPDARIWVLAAGPLRIEFWGSDKREGL